MGDFFSKMEGLLSSLEAVYFKIRVAKFWGYFSIEKACITFDEELIGLHFWAI
jgi:hypothetical protein